MRDRRICGKLAGIDTTLKFGERDHQQISSARSDRF
jgi:hypothetical protein